SRPPPDLPDWHRDDISWPGCGTLFSGPRRPRPWERPGLRSNLSCSLPCQVFLPNNTRNGGAAEPAALQRSHRGFSYLSLSYTSLKSPSTTLSSCGASAPPAWPP